MAEESSDDNMRDSPKIVIIGAGIAGIAAANCLADAGLSDFVILEASSRVGGRIYSIDLETAPGRKAELGANWIHGIDRNPIYKICMQHDLLSEHYQGRKLGQKILFLMESGQPVNTKMVQEIDFTYGMLMAQCEDFYQDHTPTPCENDSVGCFIERGFQEKFSRYHGRDLHIRKMILEQRLLGECIISGGHSMHDISLSEVGSFEELPGVHYVIPPGFEEVINILGQNFPKDKVLLEHQAIGVNWKRDNNDTQVNDSANYGDYEVCVECQNGKKFYANHVLVTIPLGYLKKHAGRLFNPPLPDFKLNAIDRIGMGTVNKVILEFGGQILPDEVFRLELVWDRDTVENEDLSECWVKKIGSFEAVADNVLIGWLSGREAEYMETLPEEEVGRKLVEVLKRFLRNSVKEVPALKRVLRSRWKTNPFTQGAYCYIPVGGSAEDVESMAEPVEDASHKPVLLWAGEATHQSFYSSSHGALLSGQREAQRIVELCNH